MRSLTPGQLLPLVLACAWAALAPLLRTGRDAGHPTPPSGSLPAEAPRWPADWEGRPLRPLPLTALEAGFAAEFPGTMARFTDGTSELLFRRVDGPTRKLHPGVDCLRAAGYAVKPLPARRDAQGRTWSRLLASRRDAALEAREIILDRDGRSWSDVSAWYWHALWDGSRGPWMAVTRSVRVGSAKRWSHK